MGNLWANPPFAAIPAVLSKIAADAANATRILPVWQSRPWRAEAVGHAHRAFLLPRSAGL